MHQTEEGVPFEGTKEILLSQLVLDLFSMHRNLCGQFSPPQPPQPPLPPNQARQPPSSCHSVFLANQL